MCLVSIVLMFLLMPRLFVYYDCWPWVYRWYMALIWSSAGISVMNGLLAYFWRKEFKDGANAIVSTTGIVVYLILGVTGATIMGDIRYKYVNNREGIRFEKLSANEKWRIDDFNKGYFHSDSWPEDVQAYVITDTTGVPEFQIFEGIILQ